MMGIVERDRVEIGRPSGRNRRFLVAALLCAFVGNAAWGSSPREAPTEWLEAQPDRALTVVIPRDEVDRRIGLEPVVDSGFIGIYRFGVEVPVDLSPWNSGDWVTLGEESAWRLRVSSPGAKSLNLLFDGFRIEPGARLYVVSESEGRVLGPYTERDDREDGAFGTPPLPGDSVLLVYFAPRRVAGGFVLRHVVHGYRDFFPPTLSTGPNGNSSACNVDINCPVAANHQDVKRAVALIVMGGGSCSGALLDNAAQNGSQLFLTARHCWANSGVVPGGWSFVFNFERTGCNVGGASLADAVSGGTTLLEFAGADVMLVRIDAPIPPWFNVYFLGFDATGDAVPSANSIHHPCGDPKKFNTEDHPLAKMQFQGMQMWSIGFWEGGVNEPGSSGSPLLDPTKRAVGTLCCGIPQCGSEQNGYYGRLDAAWAAGGAAYLDPLGTGNKTSPGAEGTNYLTVDIAGTAPVLPVGAEVGETIDAAFAIESTGSYPPSTVDWSLWLSTDVVPDASDVRIADGTTSSFGPRIETFALPFDLPFGSYFPILRIDTVPFELDVGDNDAVGDPISITASTKPNLSAFAISMSDVVEKGATLFADCEIVGNEFAPSSYAIEIRLSLDENLTATDPLLAKATLSGYGPTAVPITIPLSMNSGLYRVGLILPPVSEEIFLADNTFLGGEVTVVAPPPPKPDVAVTAFKSPAKGKVGKKSKFEITLGVTAFTGEFTYQIRLSPDPVITSDDVLVKSLKAKKAGTAKKELKIPTVEPGDWFIGVTVDPVDGEIDFTDNAIEGKPIVIKPKN